MPLNGTELNAEVAAEAIDECDDNEEFFDAVDLDAEIENILCRLTLWAKWAICPGPRAQGGPALAEGVIEN